MARYVVHIETVVVVKQEDPVDNGAEGGRVTVDVGRGPEYAVRDGETRVRAGVAGEQQGPGGGHWDKHLKCHDVTNKQQTCSLPPPSEADQDGLSDVVEGGEEAGPAGQVEEPLPPRGGGHQPGAERVNQEHADQDSHQPA